MQARRERRDRRPGWPGIPIEDCANKQDQKLIITKKIKIIPLKSHIRADVKEYPLAPLATLGSVTTNESNMKINANPMKKTSMVTLCEKITKEIIVIITHAISGRDNSSFLG